MATALVALIAFITVERRTAAPLMDLQLFKIPSFSAANFGGFMALFSNVGIPFLMSVYLGETQKLSALDIGLSIFFVSGVSALVNPIVGRLLGRTQPIYVLSAGLLVGAVGAFTISGIHAETSFLDLIWRLAIFGVANAMMLTAASVAAINAVPVTFAGMAAATNTALRQLGAALAPAMLGTIYTMAMTNSGGSATAGVRTAMLVTAGLLLLSGLVCVISHLLETNRRSIAS